MISALYKNDNPHAIMENNLLQRKPKPKWRKWMWVAIAAFFILPAIGQIFKEWPTDEEMAAERAKKDSIAAVQAVERARTDSLATITKAAEDSIRAAQRAREAEMQEIRNTPLVLLSKRFDIQSSYAVVTGEVRNRSDAKLDRVQAVVTYYNKAGDLITSDNALIEYDPIMPEQRSPFKVMTRHNPEMATYRVEFKKLLGSKINHVE